MNYTIRVLNQAIYKVENVNVSYVVKMIRCVFIIVAIVAVSGQDEEFLRSMQGMKGLDIRCKTEKQLNLVRSYEDHPNFDFLKITKILGEEVKVLVTRDSLNEFTDLLEKNEIIYNIFLDNVAKEVREDYTRNELARHMNRVIGKDATRPLRYYPRFAEIESYLRDLAQTYSNITTLLNIGTSYEGNPIYVLKISSGGGNKPAILIDAGIHAREWIAPTTALYAINQLVVNKTNSYLYDKLDWYIVPSLNPDGYEFTHTSYRLWRKTRSVNNGSNCYGTDANRNFDFQWMTTGASSNPCSDTYAGNKAFSEKETSRLRDFVLANKKSIKMYLTLHSYGQYILHPWGFTTELPENEPTLRRVAVVAEKALAAVNGTRYTIGSSTNVLYAAAGGSDDWVMGIAEVPLSYTIELPGGGNMGFNPPVTKIIPVGIETFEAFKEFAKYLITSNYV